MKQLVLLTRSYCHLCDDFLSALKVAQAQSPWPFEIELKDVDADAQLVALYDEKVPVLLDGTAVICHWHFDAAALSSALQSKS